MENSETKQAQIRVVSIDRIAAKRVIALASVELEIDGVVVTINGIQAVRNEPAGLRIELPRFRDDAGVWRTAINLPEEVRGPMGDAVIEELLRIGLAKARFEVDFSSSS